MSVPPDGARNCPLESMKVASVKLEQLRLEVAIQRRLK